MAEAIVKDVVLWTKHIHGDTALRAAVEGLREGDEVNLIVDGVAGYWRKMSDGKDGRPTLGLRPVGQMQTLWKELYDSRRGEAVSVALPDQTIQSNPLVYSAIGRTEEERRAALDALFTLAKEGYRSNSLVITRDDMHDRELDREGL